MTILIRYIESTISPGKDDKHWAGHFGVIISSAVIRVKSDVTVATDDAFVDVIEVRDRNISKFFAVVAKGIFRRESIRLSLYRVFSAGVIKT